MPNETRRCDTCVWWLRSASGIASAKRDPAADLEIGACQRHAPVVIPKQFAGVGIFPQTRCDRFCGEWAPRHGPGGGEREPQLRSVA